jgi:hypothetical protein
VSYLKQRYKLYHKHKLKEKNAIVKLIKSFDTLNPDEKATIRTKLNKIDKRFTSLSIQAEKSLLRKDSVILPKYIIDTKRKMIAIRYELSRAKNP